MMSEHHPCLRRASPVPSPKILPRSTSLGGAGGCWLRSRPPPPGGAAAPRQQQAARPPRESLARCGATGDISADPLLSTTHGRRPVPPAFLPRAARRRRRPRRAAAAWLPPSQAGGASAREGTRQLPPPASLPAAAGSSACRDVHQRRAQDHDVAVLGLSRRAAAAVAAAEELPHFGVLFQEGVLFRRTEKMKGREQRAG